MPSILLQLTVDADVFAAAKRAAAQMEALHAAEVRALGDEIKACPSDARRLKLEARWLNLHERQRRITANNVVRLAMAEGLKTLDLPAALKRIEEVGVAMGRPSVRKVG
jgi:hypothetical protein